MYAGQVVEEADADTLFHRPGDPYTGALLRSLPEPRRGEPLGSIPGRAPPPHLFPATRRFQERCAYAAESVCGAPIPLRRIAPAHLSRCARAEDFVLLGVLGCLLCCLSAGC